MTTPCCPKAYHCPSSGTTECPDHGGFDVCCHAPEQHVAAAIDPLVAAFEQHAMRSALGAENGVIAARARLSAVLAAARDVVAEIRRDNCEPSGAVDYATEKLERALAAADGAR